MSFIAPPTSTIWEQPGQTPENVAVWNGAATEVDGSTTPVQIGGIATTWTTVNTTGTTNQVVLSGEGNILNVGTGAAEIQAIGTGGNVIEAVQVLGDGTKIISTGSFGNGLETANPITTFVDTSVQVTGDVIGQPAVTISTASGGLITGGFYSYASGGTGDDQLSGSAFSDFFRGGMGNDTINTFGGNDLVRGGAGSDQITLGTGNDTLYYTFDQLQSGDIDTVTDFNAAAGDVDILAVQADRVGGTGNFGSFGGFGTNSLSITDSDGSVTTVQAQAGYTWQQADIIFVV